MEMVILLYTADFLQHLDTDFNASQQLGLRRLPAGEDKDNRDKRKCRGTRGANRSSNTVKPSVVTGAVFIQCVEFLILCQLN